LSQGCLHHPFPSCRCPRRDGSRRRWQRSETISRSCSKEEANRRRECQPLKVQTRLPSLISYPLVVQEEKVAQTERIIFYYLGDGRGRPAVSLTVSLALNNQINEDTALSKLLDSSAPREVSHLGLPITRGAAVKTIKSFESGALSVIQQVHR
jgi:hypothetical protein